MRFQNPQCEGVNRDRILFTSKSARPRRPIADDSSTIFSKPALRLKADAEKRRVSLFMDPNDPFFHAITQLVNRVDVHGDISIIDIRIVGDALNSDLSVSTCDGFINVKAKDKINGQYSLMPMPFTAIRVEESGHILPFLRMVANFYWHLHSNVTDHAKLSDKISVEFLSAVGDAHIKFTNTCNVALYIALFHFNVADLTIEEYRLGSTSVDGNDSFCLPGKESLTIGLNNNHDGKRPPTKHDNKHITGAHVNFLKLYISTNPSDYSSRIAQMSPLDHNATRADCSKPAKRCRWGILKIPIAVQQLVSTLPNTELQNRSF
ncbi:hypothetical protein H0H87_012364 [Tephrocybe sp. NHM501043]|nr:hypothetical protein H0H87_012364 [Tephrocybe sp. NHM501043]